MIIGIDASRANKKTKTGVEWYAYHLIQEFKKIDSENHYFLYSNERLSFDLGKCPDNFTEKVLSWPFKKFWTLGRLSWEMFSKRKPEVLFVPAHTLPFFSAKKKTVVTIHDIGFEHFPHLYNWSAKIYHKFSIQVIKRLADKIITVSEFCKNDLVENYKIDPKKIVVIYNGYDEQNFFVREKATPLAESPYAIFVGRLEEKKNISRLVEAFANYKKKSNSDLKLVLVGSRGFGFEKIQQKIIENNLTTEVIITGWLSTDKYAEALSGAKFFIFPSLFEGFGIPIIEAMACGVPVACSGTTSLAEIAGDSAFTFDPQSIEEMKGAFEVLEKDENLRGELKARGLIRAKQFSWGKCARETLQVLLSR